MKTEILTRDEVRQLICREVRRMAKADEIKIAMEFSIADDDDHRRLVARVAKLEKALAKGQLSPPPPAAPTRYDAINS